jgi:ankyrin repeat protein
VKLAHILFLAGVMALLVVRPLAASPIRPIDNQLLVACRDGGLDEVKKLIAQGADVNVKESDMGIAPLMNASWKADNADVIALLIRRGASVNAADSDGKTALMRAAAVGSVPNLTILLKHGARVEACDKDGETALFDAASHFEAARLLLKHHANVNARSKNGEQPIHNASNGGLDCVRLLVTHGANVNAKDDDGFTPLMWSVYWSSYSTAAYLPEKGADLSTVDADGDAAWMVNVHNVRIVTLMLEHGADVKTRTKSGLSALHKAAAEGRADVVQALIKHGADVNARTPKGDTAYTLAMGREDFDRDDIVAVLVEAGEKDAKPIPKPPDIPIAENSDEAAVIRLLIERRTANTNGYIVVQRDTEFHKGAIHDGIHYKALPDELVAALRLSTTTSKVFPALDLQNVHYARKDDIAAVFKNDGGWDRFYKHYPKAKGYMSVSLPVFDRDHSQALIYVEFGCGGLCGTGNLFLLRKTETGWMVVKEVGLWIS